MDPPAQPSSNSWSIYTRSEITQKYKILDRVGSGAYSDVYRAQRLSDNATVALKEIHDYQSAFREIEALQLLKNSPNVVYLHEYFWSEEDDAVLVLEYVRTDLGAVIREAKKDWKGLEVGEIKRWMLQILSAVDSCHRSMVVHRDLKPANLLVTDDGVLKLADFGQARILVEPGFVASLDRPHQEDQSTAPQSLKLEHSELVPEDSRSQEPRTVIREECLEELDGLKARGFIDETDKDANINDGDASCLATCTASDIGSLYSLDTAAHEMTHSPLTSCVGTRWYRAPELLYGSTNYGLEIDLWSLGCIFAELLGLNRPFPGSSDIDQINQIFNVLGNLNEEAWPGCSDLPDYKIISFAKVEDPIGLEGCLPSRSRDEVLLVKKLLCYDPANRATAMELLHDNYFSEEPLPVPVSELRVPSTDSSHDESSSGGWCSCDYRDEDLDSDFEGFGPLDVRETDSGFSICFS